MEEQLPTPISELIILNLYLGSITFLIGLVLIGWVMKRNGKFSWIKFTIISVLLIILGSSLSLLIWANWNLEFDIMIGPFHIPAVISILMAGTVLLKLFGLNIIKRETSA